MKRSLIKAVALMVIIAACITLIPDIATAEEGNKFVNFLRKVFVYPFGVTKKSTEVVTETATKGAETVMETGKAAAGVATGQLEKTKDLIVEPVTGSVETGYTAVEGTVKMPIEAAEEEPAEEEEEEVPAE